jgi:hypothetical protein
MNNQDHISESLERNYFFGGVKILKFFDADLGSGMEKNSDPGYTSRIRNTDRRYRYHPTPTITILIVIWVQLSLLSFILATVPIISFPFDTIPGNC